LPPDCTLQDARRALEATLDVGQLRRAHMVTVTQLLDAFSALMAGDGAIDMRAHGQSSDEEVAALQDDRWPMLEDMEYEGELFPAGAGACLCRLVENLVCFGACVAVRPLADEDRECEGKLVPAGAD
jgi:hypothetical protein